MRFSQLFSLCMGTFWLLIASAVGAGLWLRTVVKLPETTEIAAQPVVVTKSPPAEAWPGREVWAGPEEVKGSARVARYKLAGTFQVFEGESEKVESAALVDDQQTGVQQIVREGDELGIFEVGTITEERMRLLWGGRSWVLSLSGVEATQTTMDPEEEKKVMMESFDFPPLETTRFGKRVKENYWVLEREKLKGYIDEMMEPRNMVRTVNLYRSFSQVGEEGKDEEFGFQIGMKAEQDFFKDMGLQDGDIIRKANSMKMKTQRRAEYLLREFYNDNMSAIVLDVERNGEMQQHIYLVR